MRLPASVVSLLLAAGCAHAPAPAREASPSTTTDAADERPMSSSDEASEPEDAPPSDYYECITCGMG